MIGLRLAFALLLIDVVATGLQLITTDKTVTRVVAIVFLVLEAIAVPALFAVLP